MRGGKAQCRAAFEASVDFYLSAVEPITKCRKPPRRAATSDLGPEMQTAEAGAWGRRQITYHAACRRGRALDESDPQYKVAHSDQTCSIQSSDTPHYDLPYSPKTH